MKTDNWHWYFNRIQYINPSCRLSLLHFGSIMTSLYIVFVANIINCYFQLRVIIIMNEFIITCTIIAKTTSIILQIHFKHTGISIYRRTLGWAVAFKGNIWAGDLQNYNKMTNYFQNMSLLIAPSPMNTCTVVYLCWENRCLIVNLWKNINSRGIY